MSLRFMNSALVVSLGILATGAALYLAAGLSGRNKPSDPHIEPVSNDVHTALQSKLLQSFKIVPLVEVKKAPSDDAGELRQPVKDQFTIVVKTGEESNALARDDEGRKGTLACTSYAHVRGYLDAKGDMNVKYHYNVISGKSHDSGYVYGKADLSGEAAKIPGTIRVKETDARLVGVRMKKICSFTPAA